MQNIFETVVLFLDKGELKVECLYIGFSGVDAEETYDKALKSGRKFSRAFIRSGMHGARPLPLVVSEMKGTTPTFVNPKPTEAPKPSEPSPEMKALIKKEDDERQARFEQAAKEEEARQARLRPATPPPAPAAPANPGEKTLRTDGPTLEEYVAAGYAPETYPPEGFAEVPSEALALYKANAQQSSGTGEAQTSPVQPVADTAEPPKEAAAEATPPPAPAPQASTPPPPPPPPARSRRNRR